MTWSWSRRRLVAAMLVVATVAVAGTVSTASGNDSVATEAQARSAAVEFFRSQNERRYDDTCRLLSRGFYRTHALRDRQTCTAVMRVAFVWSGKIVFRIGTVARDGDRFVVRAVVDGVPGRIVLVREDGTLRILAVQGG
jgi:hypothetical protein